MMNLQDKVVLNDVIEWDVGNWSRALSYWNPVVASLHAESSQVLCLGERNGGLSLWFALQGFKVVCSDFGAPSEKAKALHESYHVSDKIEYADVNVFSIPYADGCFDLIACKSVIGGLKLDRKDPSTRTLMNQQLAVSEIHRVLKPGGYFLGAENMRGSFIHQVLRHIVKGKKIGWRHLRIEEIRLLFHDFATANYSFFGYLGQFIPGDLMKRVSAKIDEILSVILPAKWLYIGFIVARK